MKVKRWILALAALAVALLASGAAFGAEVSRISKEEAKALLEKKEAVAIDVRIEKDWKKSDMKIAGAVREEPKEVEKWAGKYPKEQTFILYCA